MKTPKKKMCYICNKPIDSVLSSGGPLGISHESCWEKSQQDGKTKKKRSYK